MDERRFDAFARAIGGLRTRRGALALLATATSWPLLDVTSTDAKKKKKKKTKKKGKKNKNKKKSPVCTPSCSGCGGGDGCGGTCGCSANQFCDGGTCRTCNVTCSADPIACGSALNQRLADGGTIYVCPGTYQGNFQMGTAKVIGAGQGANPATSTILDAAGSGRVVTISDGALAELIGLRITGGKVTGNHGGGVRAGTADLRITNCTITENEAEHGGGGVHAAGPFSLTNSTVSQNTGPSGAGLLLAGTLPTYITNSVISANGSDAEDTVGGGLYNNYSSLTIVGTEISRNHVTRVGGGIFNYLGTITLNATCKVVNNTAPAAGGIGATNADTVHLNGAAVTGNSAPQCVNVTGC